MLHESSSLCCPHMQWIFLSPLLIEGNPCLLQETLQPLNPSSLSSSSVINPPCFWRWIQEQGLGNQNTGHNPSPNPATEIRPGMLRKTQTQALEKGNLFYFWTRVQEIVSPQPKRETLPKDDIRSKIHQRWVRLGICIPMTHGITWFCLLLCGVFCLFV